MFIDVPVKRLVEGGRQYLRLAPVDEHGVSLSYSAIVVLVHCFGCNALMEMHKFAPSAGRYGLLLLAPEGLQESFNSPSCCGEARRTGVDDVAFIDAIVSREQDSRGKDVLPAFASGFSNGGFLVSILPSVSRTHWHGIAPTAGHEYSLSMKRPVPIYMHHCEEDEKVHASGCCDDAPCCCGIAAEKCVSTMSLFARWRRINRCNASIQTVGPGGSICHVGVGCRANTTLCLHNSCYHAQWARSFPAAQHVSEFFAREACFWSRGDGGWDWGRGVCEI
mmetsp:Transcript_37616/g.87966  ORF Transcript_37616/g.87966 Transcript_37616/m.87966 type:complete len:278 (-) Transcript_37616:90-923(-)|eukprot:CAMPEP_0119376436 /NCGR_PEP_ID=MMETSP1334-20130426/40076_1 /TAXON_ID=127549 /ORGANISM="Calcidiscus leptoporus, Strain RCC1130" /LENGTH=277 /DNA_ID=CAMNT_0007394997 /DNA_START=73 /DNA_END=906 /DNA_ORIENTATION=-